MFKARFINLDGIGVAMTFSINGTTTIDSSVLPVSIATGDYVYRPVGAEYEFVSSISTVQTRTRRSDVAAPTTQVGGEEIVAVYPPLGTAAFADGSVTTFYILGGAPNNTFLALSDKPSTNVEVTISTSILVFFFSLSPPPFAVRRCLLCL